MDSKSVFVAAFGAALAVACSNPPATPDTNSENLIGTPLASISALSKSDGQSKSSVLIFDETSRKIHQFDLSNMTFEKSLNVQNPQEKHYLIYQDQGAYVLDLSMRQVSVFDHAGVESKQVLKFAGDPLSAAFNSDLNLAVVYDSLSDVGILQLDATGGVRKAWVGGSLVAYPASIASGDLLDDGRLVLGLSNGSLLVADTQQILAQGSWAGVTPFATGFSQVNWVAPIHGSPNLVLIKADSSFAVVDLQTHIVTSQSISGWQVEKYSKSNDAHAVLRSKTDANALNLLSVSQGQIQIRSLLKQPATVMASYLSVSDDSWTYVDTTLSYTYAWNDLNQIKESRWLKQYRISDMRALENRKAPDKAQLSLSKDYLFALYPSALGRAERWTLGSDEIKVLSLFNMPALSGH